MSFVVPERKRPSYAALTRALGVGTLVSAMVAVVALQVATLGEGVSPVAVAFLALPLSVPGGVWLTRVVLERRTGYAMPWWIALVGVVVSWVATPWAGAWVVGEILSGTFGGDGLEAAPAPAAADAPLDFQTGLAYIPPPAPVAPPVDALPALEPLRLVAPPPVDEPTPSPLDAPAFVAALPEPLAPAAAPEPVAAFPLPEAPPALVETAAPAAALLPPEPPAPAYEPDPEPTPVAAPTEPALAEAAPVVVEHVAPLHALPPLEEAETPFFLPPSDLEPAAAGDPFAAFWLDPEAPSPEGLTPGYLPPLTGMWRTPLGDKL